MTIYSTDAATQAAYSFLVAQSAHIETEVNEVKYSDIQYPELVPVDFSADELAKSVTYYSSDRFGAAKWVNPNSDDIPMVGTSLAPHEVLIHTAGVGYGFGRFELLHAAKMGHDLPTDEAKAARRAFMEFVDSLVLYGDTTKGYQGLINHTDVTVAPVTGATWASKSGDEILADINDLLVGVRTGTRYTSMANTLLLPPAKMSALTSKRLEGTSTSVMSYLAQTNAYTSRTGQPLLIREVFGLETAGAGGVQRMVAYNRDSRVLKLHMPMEHQFYEVFQSGPMNFKVPGIFRVGGLDVRQPAEVRYGDGI